MALRAKISYFMLIHAGQILIFRAVLFGNLAGTLCMQQTIFARTTFLFEDLAAERFCTNAMATKCLQEAALRRHVRQDSAHRHFEGKFQLRLSVVILSKVGVFVIAVEWPLEAQRYVTIRLIQSKIKWPT